MEQQDRMIKIVESTLIDEVEMLSNTNKDAKKEYLEVASLVAPNNIYGNLDHSLVRRNVEQLDVVISNYKGNSFADQLLLKLLINRLRKNKLVLLCDLYNRGQKDNSTIKDIKKNNEKLYGAPKIEDFKSILKYIYDQIDVIVLSNEEKRHFEELNERLPFVPSMAEPLFAPDKDCFDKFCYYCELFFEPLFHHIPQKPFYSAKDVCKIANNIFTQELKGYGWKATVKDGAGYASVSQIDKIFYVPGSRSKGEYVFEDVKGVIVHEIGVHIIRSLPFQKCLIKDMCIGMPDYISFEEGLAKAVEQSLCHKFVHSGLIHYISIGLGYFYNMNFRQVYEIQWRLQTLARKATKQQCFDSVQRAFRGTGELINSKDLAYYNGNITIWRYLSENIDSDTLFDELFLSGKTCPNDKWWEHVAYELKTGWESKNISVCC